VETVGQIVFYVALGIGAMAAVASLSGLAWMIVVAIRNHGARRPMWLNYARLIVALAVPTMLVGLVLWGRADWWFVLLFAPFVATRFILFRVGSSISRRNQD
jgi:hypothetical protein